MLKTVPTGAASSTDGTVAFDAATSDPPAVRVRGLSLISDNQEERRKNAGGYEGRHGPPPPPDSPEAAIARSEGGSSTHSAITPGASGNSDTKGAMDGAEQFDEEDTEADDESEEATSND